MTLAILRRLAALLLAASSLPLTSGQYYKIGTPGEFWADQNDGFRSRFLTL